MLALLNHECTKIIKGAGHRPQVADRIFVRSEGGAIETVRGGEWQRVDLRAIIFIGK